MEISPSVLEFSGPFTKTITRTLQLHNKTPGPMAYKVKTTAPKVYCVRPNASRVNPGEKIEVQIILQGLKHEPPADFKCRDKFLVQTVPIEPELETYSISELWTYVEKNAKDRIADCKIRVAYVLTPDSTAASTPVREAAPGAAAFATPTSNGAEPAEEMTSAVKSPAVTDAPVPAPAPAPAAETEKAADGVPQPAPAVVSEKSDVGTATARAGDQGVPIPVAAFLCFLAFLLAWLFF